MESFSVAHRRWFLALILMRVLFSSKGPQPQLAMFRTTSTCGNATCSAAAQGGLLRVSLFLLHRDRSVRDSCASTCSSSFCASHGDSFPSVSSTSRGTTKYIPAKLTAVWLLVKLHLQERGAGGSRAPIIENCWVAFGRGVWYLWFIGWRVWGYGYRSVRAVMRRVWGYGSCETARVWVSVRVMEIVIFICENLRFALVRSSFSPAKI